MLKLIELLFPKTCMGCGKFIKINAVNKWLCKDCEEDFELADSKYYKCEKCGRIIDYIGTCEFCSQNDVYYDQGYTIFEYEGKIRKSIINYKFNEMKCFSDYYSEIMADYFNNKCSNEYDYVTSVPLYRSKYWARGYNQSEVIAKKFSNKINVPYNRILKKIINTKQQSTLSATNRHKNIKDAFMCIKDIQNKNILIIDDILTTGSTINECCKTLKAAGAKKVDFIVLAYVYKDY